MKITMDPIKLMIVDMPPGSNDILTAALPSKTGPKLVIEKGNYRRFNRI
jgi:hypothetical protein